MQVSAISAKLEVCLSAAFMVYLALFLHFILLIVIVVRKSFSFLLNFSCLSFVAQGAEAVVLHAAQVLKAGQDAHVLWEECHSLHATLKGPLRRTEPLEVRVARLRSLSDARSLMASALDSIPERALSSGTETEQTLRQRFARVKTSCSRVALIGEKGGGMFAYLLSYAQSMLVVPYRRWQMSGENVDVSGLDTYDILELASKRLENGELEDSVRIMNQLQGQPRQLAQDWLDEARLFLATRQAIDLLMSEALLTTSVKLN